MPQALITINAVAGSNTDLPINTLVQLNNTNVGGETTFAWTILDQPPGAANALSSAIIQNPTFTPTKEGSYLIELIVNAGQASESRDRVVAAVRHLKTRNRVPATGEADEVGAEGWAEGAGAAHGPGTGQAGVNDLLRVVVNMKADPGIVVASIGDASWAVGDIVRASGIATLKSGLPGQEDISIFAKTNATNSDITHNPLGLAIAAVDGGAMTSAKLAYVRVFGLIQAVPITGVVNGTPVFVSDTGVLDDSAGSNSRRCGRTIRVPSANVADVWFNGLGGD